MKSVKKFLLCSLICITSLLCGCDNELASAEISRDSAVTGGTLSLVYDSAERVVYVGGEGEIVQYSQENEALGLSAGYRIGFLVTAPDAQLDLSTSTLEMNGVSYGCGDFLESVNGQKQPFFNIYPVFSESDREVTFSVKWTEGTAKQTYKIVLLDGTGFYVEE